jgi:hypothetical protein
VSRRSKAQHTPKTRRRLRTRVERAQAHAEVDRLDKEQRRSKSP